MNIHVRDDDFRDDECYGGTLVYCDCDIDCTDVAGIDPEPVEF